MNKKVNCFGIEYYEAFAKDRDSIIELISNFNEFYETRVKWSKDKLITKSIAMDLVNSCERFDVFVEGPKITIMPISFSDME